MKMSNERSFGSIARGYGLDTCVVLFFLAMEFGRGTQWLSIDSALIGTTLAMLVILPYFLPMYSEDPGFGRWLAVRSAIGSGGAALGIALQPSGGTVVADAAGSMPMTLLILTGMISCYIQFYSLLKLRLAK